MNVLCQHYAITNTFVALKYGHIVAAVLLRAQLWSYRGTGTGTCFGLVTTVPGPPRGGCEPWEAGSAEADPLVGPPPHRLPPQEPGPGQAGGQGSGAGASAPASHQKVPNIP